MINKNKEIKVGIFLSYAVLIISNLIPLFYTPFVIKTLGIEEFGIYSLAKSFSTYLSLLNMGLGISIVRFLNKAITEKDESARQNLFNLFFSFYIILSISVLFIGIIFSVFSDSIFIAIGQESRETLKTLIFIVSINTSISVFSSFFVSVVQAHQHFIFEKLNNLIITIVLPVVIFLILLLGYKSTEMLIVTGVVGVIYGLINMYYVFEKLKFKVGLKNLDRTPIKSILQYSKYILIGEIANILYSSTDRVILGIYDSSASIAIYSVGITFIIYFESIVRTISSVLFPKINEMVSNNVGIAEMNQFFIKIGRIQFGILGLILSIFIGIGDDFIRLWVGDQYSDAYVIALLVMIPVSVPLTQNVGLSIIKAKNKHSFRAITFLILAVLNLFGSLLIVKKLGGIGCALITSISYLLGPVMIMNIYYKKVIKLDIKAFWSNILSMSTGLMIILALGFVISHFFQIDSWLKFLLISMFLTISYFIILWKKGMNTYEKQLVYNSIQILTKSDKFR